MSIRKRRGLLGLAAFLLVLPGAALVADRLLPPDLTRYRDAALVLTDRDGAWLDARTSADGDWRLPLAAAQTDRAYLRLLLATEDRRFAWHPGVDPVALLRAVVQLATHGHIVSGGSTIAMQASRLLEPHPHDLRGKLADMMRAVQLEWRYGRAGVLDIYLTLAPEGGNIEGIRAASWLYFGHAPDHLSPREAAQLVAVPRRPAALRPDRHGAALLRAMAALARRHGEILRAQDVAARVDDAVPRRPVPHDAPALLAHLWARGERGMIATTLDGLLQREVTSALRQGPLPLRGSAAALVATPDRRIIAWVGNAATDCPGCGVDMVRALRSPGSTLKPFFYGMALEDGVATPSMRIADVRMSVGGYAPQNYSHGFSGQTTFADALRQSLNLPAIQILQQVGPSRFLARLAANGVILHLPRGDARPGLALALGGEGIAMRDLAMLYVALSDDGRMAPLRGLASERPTLPAGQTRLLTARAASDIAAILRDTPPPPGSMRVPGMAFKTGTSYGGRDAWAVGTTTRWTAVVWAGRPDGTASPGLNGRASAGPLLTRVVSLLEPAGGEMAGPAHRNLALLSPALRRLSRPVGPQILFPGANTVVESRADDGAMMPVGLEAAGGVPPYRWFVNGSPLSVPPGAAPAWQPDGVGFARAAVEDANGQATSVEFEVR